MNGNWHFFIVAFCFVFTPYAFGAGKLELETRLEPPSISMVCDVKSKEVHIEVERPVSNGIINHLQKTVTEVFDSNYGSSLHKDESGTTVLYYVPIQLHTKRNFELSFTITADEKGISVSSNSQSHHTDEGTSFSETAKNPIGNEALVIWEDSKANITKKYEAQLKKIDDEFSRIQQPKFFEYPDSYVEKMKLVGSGGLYKIVRISICGEEHKFKARVKWTRLPSDSEGEVDDEDDWKMESYEEGLPPPKAPKFLNSD